MVQGWFKESRRHSLAARGVKTGYKRMKASAIEGSFGDRLTKSEYLHDRVSGERMLEIIKDPDIMVNMADRDENSYGEFLFLSLYDTRTGHSMTFYGLGLHEYRNRYFIDEWHFYQGGLPEGQPLSKARVLKEIDAQRAEMIARAKRANLRPNKKFELAADMADDDYAVSKYEELMKDTYQDRGAIPREPGGGDDNY